MTSLTRNTLIAILTIFLSGCSTAQFEKNMNCFAGTISGPLDKLANKINNTMTKVRSCSRLKKSKESGGISSYTHKDYVFVSSINPAALAPGQSLRSNICYEVKTGSKGANVTETRTLISPSGKKIPLSKEKFYRENGYWESNIDVKIPTNTEQGKYLVSNKVTYGDVKLEGQYKFTVWDKKALKAQCGSKENSG